MAVLKIHYFCIEINAQYHKDDKAIKNGKEYKMLSTNNIKNCIIIKLLFIIFIMRLQ